MENGVNNIIRVDHHQQPYAFIEEVTKIIRWRSPQPVVRLRRITLLSLRKQPVQITSIAAGLHLLRARSQPEYCSPFSALLLCLGELEQTCQFICYIASSASSLCLIAGIVLT